MDNATKPWKIWNCDLDSFTKSDLNEPTADQNQNRQELTQTFWEK